MSLNKSKLNKYIEMLEVIQNKFPDVKNDIEQVITFITNDYNEYIYKELERQRLKRMAKFEQLETTDAYQKITSLEPQDFIVVPLVEKAIYRLAKTAVHTKYPDRLYSMRFVKGVGTLLTRAQ